MLSYARSTAVVAWLALPLACYGDGYGGRARTMTVVCYPTPVCVTFVAPCMIPGPTVPAQAQPPTAGRTPASGQAARAKTGYATPTAAPPSTTPPPLVEPKTSLKPASP